MPTTDRMFAGRVRYTSSQRKDMNTRNININTRCVTSRLIASLIVALPLCFAACAVEPESGSDDVNADPKLKHCNVGPRGETTCFATFTEAIAHATGGRITDAPSGPHSEAEESAFVARVNALEKERIANVAGGVTTNALTVLIGTVYKSPNYSLDEQTWNFLQNRGCDGNQQISDFIVVNLNTAPYTVSDMNDNISSFHSYSNCATVMWNDWYFMNAYTNDGVPVVDMPSLGPAFNDQASSIAWY